MKFKSNTNCCVPQCTAYHSKNPDLSFHSFPRCDLTKRKWIHVLRLGKKPGANARVCSRHFKANNYKTAKPGVGCRRLVAGAIPDSHLPVPSCTTPSVNRRDQHKARRMRALQREETAGAGGSAGLQDAPISDTEGTAPASSSTGSTPTLAREAARNVENPRQELRDTATASSSAAGQHDHDDPDVLFHRTVGMQVNMFLEDSLAGPNFMDNIRSDGELRVVTGLETIAMFQGIVRCVRMRCDSGCDAERNVVITLMKVKHNVSFSLLAVLFRLSVTTVANIFRHTITIMSVVLAPVLRWPSVEEVRENMPKCFEKFQKTRVVLDCTEFSLECSKCLRCRISSYSNYKGQNTVKVLVGVSPAGLITYLSDAWGGKASDKEIFNGTRLVDMLEPYVDAVMVDKGFHIELELRERGIELFRPPFLRNKKQFSKAEAQLTAEIAAARVHVERVIGRLKQFKLLTGKVQWGLLPYMNCVLRVTSAITNLSRPVLATERFL